MSDTVMKSLQGLHASLKVKGLFILRFFSSTYSINPLREAT